ncbi:MAG: hypothetical protein ACOYOU_21280, partial [Kiritimatiellia bacterium]
ATTFATLDGARCFPQSGFERLTAGLTVGPDGKRLVLRVEGGGPKFAAGILRLLAGVGRTASAQGMQTQALNNLRTVWCACAQFEAERKKLPTTLTEVKIYLKDPDSALRDARSGQPIRLNPAVAGRKLASIKNPSETVLAYGPPGPEPLYAAFCDGSVRLLTPAQLETALKPATRTNSSGQE